MNEQPEEFSVHFVNVINQKFTPENRIHLILALQGEITLTQESGVTQLRQNQPQIINANSRWQIAAARDNILAIISVSPFLLFNRAGEFKQTAFNIEEHRAPTQAAQIAGRIKDIAILWLKKNSETWRLEAIRNLLDIFCLLLQNFTAPQAMPLSTPLSARINKAVMLIKERYREDITLHQIASQLHVTSAHLSRCFTAETGMNFRTFLTDVRFEHAVKEIAFTARPIGQIVSDNGFCSLHRFSVLFRERYGMSPGGWRRGIRDGTIASPADAMPPEAPAQTRDVNSVMLFSCLSRVSPSAQAAVNRHLPVKTENIAPAFDSEIDRIRPRRYVIAVGSFNELLKQHVQQQLMALKTLLHEFQVEIADSLEDIFALHDIYTGEPNPTWSPWSNLDIACNFLKHAGLSVVIRLSPAGESLDRLEQFIHHHILLLGQEYVQRWTFILEAAKGSEPANEPAVKWLTAIRRMLPGSRVGLALAQSQDNITLPDVELLRQTDFIAFSLIPNDRTARIDVPEYRPQDNNKVIHQQMKRIIALLKKHRLRCQLYLQSWGTLTGNTLTINGLFFRGALLMDMLLSLPAEVTMMGLWLNSEQQNEVCANNLIENNSLSLFFSATTKRPVFHILAMKARLKERISASGPGWIATRHGNVHQLLLLNSVTINPQLSIQQHLLNDYSKCFRVRLKLSPSGTWRIKKWVFDQKNGALYHQYGLHPTRYDRDEETMHYISQRSEPTLSVHDELIIQEWTTEIMMDINAVCLLELTRIAN
ncbi:helix-turn-helix domain-containing protein [Mixta tenebrionis]|uniref:Helix-turn-helix domain-containing protein n=1 Tax=Mixta tenebrionis TaxID=2562439 RepID=A0A506VAI0_9GAMM|nr:helix-turn-helix domain-containing protein [Mixta tenebrionis]TPW42459.1 helix-turn-helix domain-containing protein [Mixta tenebrionis]